ncbi:hypothetical protein LF919_05265 [Bifidobacterium pseudolongum]|uniref:Head fiber protein n=1 Tax=Bifidobacterium pseudolongum TaxID=1694 RepID=A0A395XGY7_9BIFI|nr:hypothetical protein [Bifidobacterium pseudolongum]MCH4835308.1 hypothetical protein [Bifidobacterium pseudolongum]RGW09908.1 hypothetical protein DWV92_04720 [Bifidobacterium pseudolongum]
MAVSDFPPQTFVVTSDGKKHKPGVLDPRVRLVNPDGTAYKPAATAGAAVADATDATLLTQFNALLASLRAAGVIDGS